MIDMSYVNGLELPVTGGQVMRAEDGRIHAAVRVAQATALFGDIGKALQRDDGYDFFSSDPYISVDRESPTIFQNMAGSHVPTGTMMALPGLGKFPAQFDFRSVATTEAIGFVEGNSFMGTMQLSYEFFIEKMPSMIRMALEQRFGRFPSVLRGEGGGTFEIELLDI